MDRTKLILPGDPGFLSPENVNKLHSMDDLDTSSTAHHHTLGRGANQAAAGSHGHWGPWVTLANLGWSPYAGLQDLSANYNGGMARKSLDGTEVEMVGTLKGVNAWAAGQWIFTLPTGYRPPKTEILIGGTDTGGAQQYARFDIQGSNGAVIAQFGLAAGANIFLGRMKWSTKY